MQNPAVDSRREVSRRPGRCDRKGRCNRCVPEYCIVESECWDDLIQEAPHEVAWDTVPRACVTETVYDLNLSRALWSQRYPSPEHLDEVAARWRAMPH